MGGGIQPADLYLLSPQLSLTLLALEPQVQKAVDQVGADLCGKVGSSLLLRYFQAVVKLQQMRLHFFERGCALDLHAGLAVDGVFAAVGVDQRDAEVTYLDHTPGDGCAVGRFDGGGYRE